MNPAIFFLQWIVLCVVGIPFLVLMCYIVGAVLDATIKMRTNGLALFRSLISLAVIVGDPLLYFIRKQVPYLVPIEDASEIGKQERGAA